MDEVAFRSALSVLLSMQKCRVLLVDAVEDAHKTDAILKAGLAAVLSKHDLNDLYSSTQRVPEQAVSAYRIESLPPRLLRSPVDSARRFTYSLLASTIEVKKDGMMAFEQDVRNWRTKAAERANGTEASPEPGPVTS
jgi:hypothetical protein